MNPSPRQRGAAVVATLAILGLLAVPAQALNTSAYAGTALDAINDVVNVNTEDEIPPPYTEPDAAKADVTGASVEYRSGQIGFSLNVNHPTMPTTDPNWRDAASGVIWAIDVDGDNIAEYSAELTADANGDLVGEVLSYVDDTFCSAQSVSASLNIPHYTFLFDPACIGSPASFLWGAVMVYDTNPDDPNAPVGMDAVPDGDEMDGPVHSPTAPVNPNPPVTRAGPDEGLWLVARDGGIFSLNASFYGSAGDIRLNQPIVGMAADPDGSGYWFVAADGGIFSFGAPFFGSTGDIRLNQPIVGMAPTPSGDGYWMVARDGGVFTFGDAGFFGSTGDIRLNQPIVGMAPTPSGDGYWMVASDGGVFAFGDAGFFGSTGGTRLNQPIVGMAPTPSGDGYWFVARDGGVFAFGDAQFKGAAVGPFSPVVGIAPAPLGDGYWIVRADGWVSRFGSAPYVGSLAGTPLNQPIVGVAVSG